MASFGHANDSTVRVCVCVCVCVCISPYWCERGCNYLIDILDKEGPSPGADHNSGADL